jgi:prolyl-tRNA editing enzyme YbaK/EbsC (Cys-tRNA(Pro) deacylase)
LTQKTSPAETPEFRVEKFLRESGYVGNILHSEKTIFTVEDASEAVGAPPEEILKSIMCLADGHPVLVLMSGANKLHNNRVRRLAGAKKLRMASPDFVFEYSGFRVGGVPPVGYPDVLTTFLDEDLFQYPIVWAAAGTDHAFFPVSPEELLHITSGVRAEVKK